MLTKALWFSSKKLSFSYEVAPQELEVLALVALVFEDLELEVLEPEVSVLGVLGLEVDLDDMLVVKLLVELMPVGMSQLKLCFGV